MPNTKSIREITGEIWAEINMAHLQQEIPIDLESQRFFLEIAEGVLARYNSLLVFNDEDFPVSPLKKSFPDS